MKSLIVFSCIVAVALSAALPIDVIRARLLPALKHEETHDERGQYSLRYVTAEGTVVSERGRLVPNHDNTDYVLEIDGEYTYIGDDGKTYVTKYSSGRDGFKVDAEHLPKAPVDM